MKRKFRTYRLFRNACKRADVLRAIHPDKAFAVVCEPGGFRHCVALVQDGGKLAYCM